MRAAFKEFWLQYSAYKRVAYEGEKNSDSGRVRTV
jgi:hypothetical protein